MNQKAIFLDKDGTLVKNEPYNCDPACMRLLPGVGEGLKLLQQNEYKLIIVSNQSGIARGYFTEEDLDPVFEKLRSMLSVYDVTLDGIYYCPHHPEGIIEQFTKNCFCRKPMAGLVKKAALIHDIDIKKSWMIGDILHDMEAGHRAGCKSILVDAGYETEWKLNELRIPDYRVKNFKDAVDIILFPNRIQAMVPVIPA